MIDFGISGYHAKLELVFSSTFASCFFLLFVFLFGRRGGGRISCSQNACTARKILKDRCFSVLRRGVWMSKIGVKQLALNIIKMQMCGFSEETV